MNNSGALSFDAVIRDTDFAATIGRMENQLRGLTQTAVRESNKLDDTFRNLGRLAAGYFSFNALSQLPGQLIRVRGEFQQLEIAFETMLRSKERASKLTAELAQLAATTPFEFKDVAAGAKQLLAYGSTAESIVGELRTLGDVASGTSTPINDLIYLYGTLRTQGRAYAVDIRQFAGRGIPIYEELAKVLGVNKDKVNELVSAGKVGFKEVEQAFKNMTTGSGLFAGLMEKQSKSLTGLLSNLSDAWALMMNEIGKSNEGVASDVLTFSIEAVKHYQDVLDILKVLAATYGVYKTAVIASSIAQSIATATAEGWTIAQLASYRALLLAEGAQKLLNRTMLANPFVLAATLLTGLIAAVVVYREELTQAEKVQAKLSDAQNEAGNAATAELAKIQALTLQINDEGISRERRTKKLQELIALSPEHLKALTLDSVKTGEGTKAIDAYIVSLKKKIELQSLEKELEASTLRELDAKQGKNELSLPQKALGFLASTGGRGSVESGILNFTKNAAQAQKDLNTGILADEQAIQDNIRKRIIELDKANAKTAEGADASKKASAKTVENYNDQIEALKKEQSQQSTTRAGYLQYQKQIDALEQSRNRLTGQQTKAEKAAGKAAASEAKKTGPFGSIQYWDYIAQKAQEIIDKTPENNTAGLAKQIAIRDAAQAKADALKKKTEHKTFDEQLEEKKKQYELYQKWVVGVDQQAADFQFANLIQNGKSYLEFLNSEIEKLQSDGLLTPEKGAKLASLTAERDETLGKRQKIDLFRDSLEKAQVDAGNLTEALAKLHQIQDSLSGNNTDFGIKAKQLTAEQINQANAARKDQLRQFLQDVAGSEQQRVAIQKRYADLRAELDKQDNGQKTEGYKNALSEIDKAEKEEFKGVNQRTLEAMDSYKQLNKVIVEEGRKALLKRQKDLKAHLDEVTKTFGKESEEFKKAFVDSREADGAVNKDTLNTLSQFAGVMGEFGDALSGLNGSLGDTGKLLSGLADGAGLVNKGFEKDIEDSERVQIALQSVVNIINIITTSAAQRKKAEEDYYRSVIAQQQEYNLALNEQIGLRTQDSENVFVKNFAGQLIDAGEKFDDAQKKYQETLTKLAQGRAKAGLENAVDWGAVGKGAVNGAAIGTAILPGIGTAIGAGLGAIVGFFAGKKKEDEFTNILLAYPKLIQKGKDGVDKLNESLAQTLISQNLVDEETKQLLQSTIDWQKQMDEAKEAVKGVVRELAGGLGDKLRDSLVNAFKEGTDAAKAFQSTVEDILESFVTNLLFSKVFTPFFDQLQEELSASLVGGDGNLVDDFQRFFDYAAPGLTAFNEGMQAFQDAAKSSGFNVLKNKTSANSSNSLSGAIKGVTEETAGILAGNLNSIRITQADSNSVIRQQLIVLSGIKTDTNRIADNSDLLISIDKRLKDLNDNSLRGVGGIPK